MSIHILGLSAYYHDSAAALLTDGEIVAAAQEERFTRKKHDPSFPAGATRFVMKEAGLRMEDLTAVAFYDKPFLKFERLLETYHSYAPQGLRSFLAAMPVWIKEKLFMRKMLGDELKALDLGKPGKMLFPEHHLSHAASAFYPSPFEESAILTMDGVGEWATMTIGQGGPDGIKIFKQLDFPHSLGLLYSAFTYYCGFRVNSGEYKLMGLAPYGNPGSERVARWKQQIYSELIDVREDGSFLLNMEYFNFAVGLTMCDDRKWEQLFGITRRAMESELTQEYMDMALAIQQVTEEIVFKLADTTYQLTGADNLVLAGGISLNCVANGKLLRSGPFKALWIQPAAGDAGGALGAAYTAWHIWKKQPKPRVVGRDLMKGAYLGPVFYDSDIERTIRKFKAVCKLYPDDAELYGDTAELMTQGNVVGWFQGRMEFGPRALGNRSIIGDPRNPDMQKKLNLKIKYREGFRPFAPSVMEEHIEDYFDLGSITPYMLLVAPVQESRRNQLPEGYDTLPLYDRLYHLRSDVPAITHVDFSARIQSVSRDTNERYWSLINAFKEKTGYGLIVNTSFNVRGEPIVCTPHDAYQCFMRTEMDYLVMGNYLFAKSEQPEWKDAGDWREEFALD